MKALNARRNSIRSRPSSFEFDGVGVPCASSLPRQAAIPANKAFLFSLRNRAEAAAAAKDADAVAAIALEAASAPYPVDRDVAIRLVALGALHASGHDEKNETWFAEDILSSLAANGCLGKMKPRDLGMVLDVMTRSKLTRSDIGGALRVEYLSRVLNVGLRRGTYTHLIQGTKNGLRQRHASGDGSRGASDTLALSLALFHRALVVGRSPNVAMFNAVLEICFAAGDGARARAVLVEMAREGVPINGNTLSILLAHTRRIADIDAVLRLVNVQVSQGDLHLSPGMALPFVKAYIACASTQLGRPFSRNLPCFDPVDQSKIDSGKAEYLEKSFNVVDQFYERGVGVTASCLDVLVSHLGEAGLAEGALRAWREMRRGWLGPPSRRARRALVDSVGRSCVPERLENVVWPRLEPHMGEREVRRLRRVRLWHGTSDDEDTAVLYSVSGEDGSSKDIARDQATVLHRWVTKGRAPEAVQYVENILQEREHVDSRVLLAILSQRVVTSSNGGHVVGHRSCSSDDPAADETTRLQFVLDHFSRLTPPGTAQERELLIKRAEKTFSGAHTSNAIAPPLLGGARWESRDSSNSSSRIYRQAWGSQPDVRKILETLFPFRALKDV